MTQQKRSAIIIAAFILLILLTFYAAHALRQSQIAELESDVSAIRGLKRLGDTALHFRTRDQIIAESGASAEDEELSEETERFIALYRALELAAPDIDLLEAFEDYYSANVGGYYQFDDNEITILRAPGTQYAPLTIYERLLYAHEFMHVLQDQHYDLTEIFERVGESDNVDLALATEALIEGDADAVLWAVQDRLLMRMSDRQLDYLIRQAEQSMTASGTTKPVPAVIEAVFNFPYEYGAAFVQNLVDHGGWERVHQAFISDPPLSTEHIYHPERYLAGEAPIDVSLPDFGDIIGDRASLVFDGAVGEFYLRRHLITTLSQPQAAAAASGWGGDRLRIYEDGATGELLWVWHVVWDGAGDAVEFAVTYRRFLDKRDERSESDGRCWGGETTRCFRRIGRSETRISQAADRAMALALLEFAD